MYFLTHYPEQMLQVGSMVRKWNIRNEAKLFFFKQAAHLSNFKNISLTLSTRHQKWMCYELATNKLLVENFECGPQYTRNLNVVNEENDDIQVELNQLIPQLSQEATVFHPTWIHVEGKLYKCNNAFLIVGTDGLDPLFGQLDDVIVVGRSSIVYSLSLCKTLHFQEHYHSYVITVTSTKKLFSKLWDENVYHAHRLVRWSITCNSKACYLMP